MGQRGKMRVDNDTEALLTLSADRRSIRFQVPPFRLRALLNR